MIQERPVQTLLSFEYISGYSTPYFFLAAPTLKPFHIVMKMAPTPEIGIQIELWSMKAERRLLYLTTMWFNLDMNKILCIYVYAMDGACFLLLEQWIIFIGFHGYLLDLWEQHIRNLRGETGQPFYLKKKNQILWTWVVSWTLTN